MHARAKLAILLGAMLSAAQPSLALEDCYAVQFDAHVLTLQKLSNAGLNDELHARFGDPRSTFDAAHKLMRGGLIYDGRVGRCVPQLPAHLPCGQD